MGPGILLPLILGGVATLGGLLRGWQGMREAKRGTEPGTLPGTLGEGESYGGQWGISSLDGNPYVDAERVSETARLDPRVGGVLGYGSAMEGRVRPLIQGQSDRFNTLAGETGALRGRIADSYGKTSAERDQARASLGTTSTDLTNRTKALNEDVSGRLRKIADDPTIVTQNEVDAIAGNILSRTSADYRSANAMAEADAARRGRSVDAVKSTQALLSQSQENTQSQGLRDVILANAAARGQRQLAATEGLGTIGGSLLGLESDIGLRFGALGEQLRGGAEQAAAQQAAIESGLLGQEGGFTTAATQPMIDFESQLAGIPLALGDIAAQRGDYNTLLRSGAYNAAADRLGNVGSGLLGLGFGRLDAQAAQQAAGSQRGIGDYLGLGFGGLGALGLATGAPDNQVLSALLMGNTMRGF